MEFLKNFEGTLAPHPSIYVRPLWWFIGLNFSFFFFFKVIRFIGMRILNLINISYFELSFTDALMKLS